MNLPAVLLGVINIAIVIAILILIGLIIEWFLSWMGLPVPLQVRKVYLIVVALIGLYLLVALLLGMPTVRLIGFPAYGVQGRAVATVPASAATDLL